MSKEEKLQLDRLKELVVILKSYKMMEESEGPRHSIIQGKSNAKKELNRIYEMLSEEGKAKSNTLLLQITA